ncbi:hypothetical protein BvCmsKSP061_00070 [Escherichia coli]|nr:hypothetical protein BvCmsKSP061_00070 [Escherichia coli]
MRYHPHQYCVPASLQGPQAPPVRRFSRWPVRHFHHCPVISARLRSAIPPDNHRDNCPPWSQWQPRPDRRQPPAHHRRYFRQGNPRHRLYQRHWHCCPAVQEPPWHRPTGHHHPADQHHGKARQNAPVPCGFRQPKADHRHGSSFDRRSPVYRHSLPVVRLRSQRSKHPAHDRGRVFYGCARFCRHR